MADPDPPRELGLLLVNRVARTSVMETLGSPGHVWDQHATGPGAQGKATATAFKKPLQGVGSLQSKGLALLPGRERQPTEVLAAPSSRRAERYIVFTCVTTLGLSCCTWDLAPRPGDRIWAPHMGPTGSQPLDPQRSPCHLLSLLMGLNPFPLFPFENGSAGFLSSPFLRITDNNVCHT